MFTIDTSTDFGNRVRTRLTDEHVIWLLGTTAEAFHPILLRITPDKVRGF